MNKCPCCSGSDYDCCCELFIDGKLLVQTVEELMRSRYTAYVKVNMDYVRKTMHPSNRDSFDEKNARIWSINSQWKGLQIIEVVDGGREDDTGTVKFVASYVYNDKLVEHEENSLFEKIDRIWYYKEGK